MKKTKREQQRDRWVQETQMFQRIARVTELSDAELAAQWEADNPKN